MTDKKNFNILASFEKLVNNKWLKMTAEEVEIARYQKYFKYPTRMVISNKSGKKLNIIKIDFNKGLIQ